MSFQDRAYQAALDHDIHAEWGNGAENVCAVLPTGGGKTHVFGGIIQKHDGASCAIAHRKELVGQMAMSLARREVPHRIIGPHSLVKYIVRSQLDELGRSWFNPNAHCAVAGVNTLVNRKNELSSWLQQVTLWVQDEGHHVLKDNVWGKAASMFPNARGLGVTATPTRADGKGLGRHADGLYDALVEGPSMRWLINEGYLVDYRLSIPPNDVNLIGVEISDSTGDFKPNQLKKAVRESHIVGDVVKHYLTRTPGKRAVVFATDVETATDFARLFNVAGVRAEVVSADTEPTLRDEIIKRFRAGYLDVLVNVDLFGEGFDLPAIDVVIFARHTESFALYAQQFGRVLRPIYAAGYDLSTRAGRLAAIAASVKPYAIVHDHVGNIIRHNGPPDCRRVWTLDAREKGRRSTMADDELALKPCRDCTRPYQRFLAACPHCGYRPEPAERSAPQFVDGDLLELDAETLARMRGEVAAIDGDRTADAQRMQYAGAPSAAINGMLKQHRLKQEAQQALRAAIAWWAGWHRAQGRSDSEIYRRFYLAFGIDTLSAKALPKVDAMELAARINTYLGTKCK